MASPASLRLPVVSHRVRVASASSKMWNPRGDSKRSWTWGCWSSCLWRGSGGVELADWQAAACHVLFSRDRRTHQRLWIKQIHKRLDVKLFTLLQPHVCKSQHINGRFLNWTTAAYVHGVYVFIFMHVICIYKNLFKKKKTSKIVFSKNSVWPWTTPVIKSYCLRCITSIEHGLFKLFNCQTRLPFPPATLWIISWEFSGVAGKPNLLWPGRLNKGHWIKVKSLLIFVVVLFANFPSWRCTYPHWQPFTCIHNAVTTMWRCCACMIYVRTLTYASGRGELNTLYSIRFHTRLYHAVWGGQYY